MQGRHTTLHTFLSTLSLRRATDDSTPLQISFESFLSTLSLRRATGHFFLLIHEKIFLSTLSLRRATTPGPEAFCCMFISIHALLAESDVSHGLGLGEDANFYPRSPCGERPAGSWARVGTKSYFYPRSPCGERPHARSRFDTVFHHFYPRSPCGERHIETASGFRVFPFLSTLSLRRATTISDFTYPEFANFYPRSPCGERPFILLLSILLTQISIHALLAESDVTIHQHIHSSVISIHALLAESDKDAARQLDKLTEFLSTLSLRRATLVCHLHSPIIEKFLSTLSLRRATSPKLWLMPLKKFLSTLSLRRATSAGRGNSQEFEFLSTLSLRRATITMKFEELNLKHFYPRSPCGERPSCSSFFIRWISSFLSTLSLRRATFSSNTFD